MKIRIVKDEQYPDYGWESGENAEGVELKDVDEETIKRWREVFDAYDSVQRELESLYREGEE